MISLILRYGTIAGLIVAVPMVWRMLTLDADAGGSPLGGMAVTYLVMLVGLTAVFLGIKHYRDRVLGGVIRFLPAFGIGLGISFIASLFYVIGWEISMAYSKFDFAQWYADYMVESVKAKGGSAEQIAKASADAQAFAASYAKPLVRIPWTFIEIFPVGVLVSLVSAAILRKMGTVPIS